MLCCCNMYFNLYIAVNKAYNYGCTLNPTSWTWGVTPRMNTHRVRVGEVDAGAGAAINDSHHCTVERLYAWEKKLFMEVKVKIYLHFFFLEQFLLLVECLS